MTTLIRVLGLAMALAVAAPAAWPDEPVDEDVPTVQGKPRPPRDDVRDDRDRGRGDGYARDSRHGGNYGRDNLDARDARDGGSREQGGVGYDRGGDRGPPVTAEVRCASRDGRAQECRLPFPGRVMLARQDSRSACLRGHSWDVRRGSLWVYNGCRGRFLVESRGGRRY